MDPLALGAALAVLVTVVLGVVALASAATSTAGNMARQRLQNLVGTSVLEQPAVGSPLREQQSGELPRLGQAFLGQEWAAKTALDLSRADIRLRVSEYVTLRVALALILCAVVFVLIPSRPVAMVMAVALAAVGYLAPALFLRYRKQKRLDKLESQLEEALTLISNSLRAGFGLLQSLELTAQQVEHPIATELRRTIHDINIGSSTEEALLALNERACSYDLDIVVTAILIQRTVGGNLAEILDTVARTMRERARLRGEIKTLTAQQMLTGYVLGVLPIAVMGLLFIVSNEYVMTLFTTVAGQVLLVGAAVMEFLGMMLIRRILAIEV